MIIKVLEKYYNRRKVFSPVKTKVLFFNFRPQETWWWLCGELGGFFGLWAPAQCLKYVWGNPFDVIFTLLNGIFNIWMHKLQPRPRDNHKLERLARGMLWRRQKSGRRWDFKIFYFRHWFNLFRQYRHCARGQSPKNPPAPHIIIISVS